MNWLLGLIIGLISIEGVNAADVPTQIQLALARLKSVGSFEEWQQSSEYPARWVPSVAETQAKELCDAWMDLRADDLAVFQGVARDLVQLPCREKILKKLEASFATLNLFTSVTENMSKSFFAQREMVVPSFSEFLKGQKQSLYAGEWVLVFVSDKSEKHGEVIQKVLGEKQLDGLLLNSQQIRPEDSEWMIDSEDWRKPNPTQLVRAVSQKLDANEKGVLVFHADLEQTSASFRAILGEFQKRKIRFVSLQFSTYVP